MMQKGELREQRFHTGTVELNYAEGPASGEALLYLHGGDGRWQEGRALLEELASAFQVYGLDLRGHGLSGRVPGAYRLQDYVPDVATFLEQVVTRPTVVIGHSMGGHVGIMLAARTHLDAATFEVGWAAGQAMTEEQAVTLALQDA
jgi:pimeloyl-ACP methyl ester carboxylesterase